MEVDSVDKPETKDTAQRSLLRLEDYIDMIPDKEQEFQTLVERVNVLDNATSSLVIGQVNSASHEFNVLKLLLRKKHAIVSELVGHYSAEEAVFKKIQESLKEAERILNSPMIIPCNVHG